MRSIYTLKIFLTNKVWDKDSKINLIQKCSPNAIISIVYIYIIAFVIMIYIQKNIIPPLEKLVTMISNEIFLKPLVVTTQAVC